ncbi:MAG: 6,7-dimethyl-8-ribityllumazine synthase [Armatimonadetes bacterium]|nr:6,7-dimethyl-8-ribityllumazine synthase [Armatimonadota bacterium]
MAQTIEGRMTAAGKRFTVIASRWNEFVTRQLVDGALRALRQNGAQEPDVVWVPGTWEMPIAAARAAQSGADAVICVGCILQGATGHARQLSNLVAGALADLSLRAKVPVTWGVLTCETQEQAIERAGMKLGNKGEQAALAAIEITSVIEQVQG